MVATKTECQNADIGVTCKEPEAAWIYVSKLHQGRISIGNFDVEYYFTSSQPYETKQIRSTVLTTDSVKPDTVL